MSLEGWRREREKESEVERVDEGGGWGVEGVRKSHFGPGINLYSGQ